MGYRAPEREIQVLTSVWPCVPSNRLELILRQKTLKTVLLMRRHAFRMLCLIIRSKLGLFAGRSIRRTFWQGTAGGAASAARLEHAGPFS